MTSDDKEMSNFALKTKEGFKQPILWETRVNSY